MNNSEAAWGSQTTHVETVGVTEIPGRTDTLIDI